jgi:phosphocarrier protein
MLTTETEIINKLGLHARASAKLTQMAGKFQCEVWMSKGARRINAKSIMGDEAAAMEALLALIADYFGEGE